MNELLVSKIDSSLFWCGQFIKSMPLKFINVINIK